MCKWMAGGRVKRLPVNQGSFLYSEAVESLSDA